VVAPGVHLAHRGPVGDGVAQLVVVGGGGRYRADEPADAGGGLGPVGRDPRIVGIGRGEGEGDLARLEAGRASDDVGVGLVVGSPVGLRRVGGPVGDADGVVDC